MAARGHVQDPNDRRLRPIYDYLDNGNNKMAIQQADKLLKKHRDLHCAKVLKAIGLQRTGKQDEAFTLAQEVASLEPTDDNSLQALTILYREMHRPELVTKLYEAAVRKVPASEEYHSHLFMAYARIGEYKKMQQAGMALYKIVPKNPYYFWSVMSLVMQAISAQDEKLSQTMFLPLAERMVEKMVKEEKIEAEAEVQLYFMILERLGKYVEALEVVRGQLGEKLTSELQSRENKCMLLYRQLKRWPECNALSYKLLLKNPDDWQFYLSYFDSLFHLIDQSWTPPEEGDHCTEGEVHCSVSQAISFVEERVAAEEVKESRPLRGPYLARLELIRRLRQRSCSEEQQLGDPLELMFQYFVKFGDKPCCITDLKIFLDLLLPDQCVQFINRLTEAVPLGTAGEDDVGVPGDTCALQRHLCVAQLGRALGLQHALDTDGKLALIRELKIHYHHGLQFGKSCLKTELQHSDMYCLMAAHVYIDLWMETGKEHMMWQGLGLLEEGLSHSSSNAQFKLLLLLLFCRLGAFEPVVDLYSSLDAKHVQHDTIGFLLTRYAESLGQFAAASQSCNFSLRFFHSNQKDTSEYIIQAYKYGAFEKIPEFIAFRNRLNNSLHFAQVRTERMLLDLFLEADISSTLEESVKSMSICPEEDDIPWDNIRDNRDLTVFVSWNPKDRELNEEHRQRSVEEEVLWLKIRSLTLRLVACLCGLSHPPSVHNSEKTTENGVASKSTNFQPLLSQLESTISQAAQFTEKHSQHQYPFLGPPSTRLAQALASGSCQCQLSALQLPIHLQELEASGLDQSAELQAQIANLFKSLTVQLQDMLNKCKGELMEMKDSQCKTQPSLLENLVYFLETICIVLWVSNYCGSTLRPLKSSLQKKKKKKKDTASAVTPVVLSGFQEFLGSLQGVLGQALEHIKGQESSLVALKLEALSLQGVSQTEEEASFTKTAMDKVQSSYLRSLQEVGDLLRKRLDTLKSLKI
ncbi:N-alpha-acetyltransferase 25, NatB auxiliary subunit [Astyanax mexicanus]|uniref:N-alpha-acetyltransferase 25, NatB auxiliary subunit n=1 Tax=Astyanax mexicanus TaxID=7994 RepID=UPI0020CB0ADB|nr:N-alpha-acetyltransferase 25, NatB auxiliary subunit [Astyanax mexicanus]